MCVGSLLLSPLPLLLPPLLFVALPLFPLVTSTRRELQLLRQAEQVVEG